MTLPRPAGGARMALQSDRVPTVLRSRITLGVFAVLGVVVALAEWHLIPRGALLVGAPAIAAALLLDTFLYNEFLVQTGPLFWVELYAFLYVEAVVVGAAVWAVQRVRDEQVSAV